MSFFIQFLGKVSNFVIGKLSISKIPTFYPKKSILVKCQIVKLGKCRNRKNRHFTKNSILVKCQGCWKYVLDKVSFWLSVAPYILYIRNRYNIQFLDNIKIRGFDSYMKNRLFQTAWKIFRWKTKPSHTFFSWKWRNLRLSAEISMRKYRKKQLFAYMFRLSKV